MTIAVETQRFPDRQYYSENQHERTSVAKSYKYQKLQMDASK